MSEAENRLYLHELSLAVEKSLRRTMKLPSPEPDRGYEDGMLQHTVAATWAPDDTIVAMEYTIEDHEDPRAANIGWFEVCSVWCRASHIAASLNCTVHDSGHCRAPLKRSSAVTL